MPILDFIKHEIWSDINAVWHYSLIRVNESEIRISNIILGILLVVLGLKYSNRFTDFVQRYLKSKLTSDKDSANAIEKIINYSILCLYIITILEIINIPLSIFAFIGGALVIGIGFGAQTIIGNFINSLIIMIERPIKIGDIVEIDGIIGTVSSIGARCANLTTFSNMEVLVPNSKLMQNTLLNWTLNDHRIKYQLEVFVAKSQSQPIDHDKLFSTFENILNQLNQITKISNISVKLVEIKEHLYTYLLSVDWDLKKDYNIYNIKNDINLNLINNLKNINFEVKHMDLINLKSKTEGEPLNPFSRLS